MYKKYYGDEERVDYVRSRMSELKIQEEYRDYVADILLRRAYEYELTNEEIADDIDTLVESLQEIVVEEAPKGCYNTWGAYFAEYKKILINDRTLVEATNEQVYATFAHELYHALTHDAEGNDLTEWLNPITQERTASLREVIVEAASARTIRPTGITKENPYYSNYTQGYSQITFAIPLLASVAGVKEKDLLKYGMKGEVALKHFLCRKELCDKGEERIAERDVRGMINTPTDGDLEIYYDSLERQRDFLNRFEANLNMLHSVCVRIDEEPLSKKEANARVRDGFLGLTNACAEMFMERAELCIDDKDVQDSLKFSFNKMYFIIDENFKQLSSKFLDSKTAEEVSTAIEKQRKQVFEAVAQKVGVRTPRRLSQFELTEDMRRFIELPDEDEREWNNSKRIEDFKKLAKDKKITVYRDRTNKDEKKIKGYFRHGYYRYLTDFMIGRMTSLPKEYKSILADVMLRRGYQYQKEPTEMMEDLEKLYQRLGSIEVGFKEGYDPFTRTLNVSAFSFIKEPKAVYERFALQTYKMLAGESPSEDKNDIVYNSILERAVHRTVYDKPKTSNPYYNNVRSK